MARALSSFIPLPLRQFYKVFKHARHRPSELGIFLDTINYFSDGLATIHNCDFLSDPNFQKAYAVGKATGSWRGTEPLWRIHTALWAASMASSLEGDFVECGVYRGGTARATVEYLGFAQQKRRYFLFDTFQGIVEEQLSEVEKRTPGRAEQYEPCLSDVKETFRSFPNVVIVPGTIPQSLSEVAIDRVTYLHLDLNCAAPEIAAAEYFWDKLVPGGVVLLDDYAYRGYLPQKQAMDAFAEKKGVKILSLPTGQGMWIRP